LGTLYLVWGIILIIAGLGSWLPFALLFPFPTPLLITIAMIAVGSALIKKYDIDKKKEKNS